ncbi:hypothetical protein BH11MYX2_BH11MYX2_05000 [soil metagenome]
MPKAPSFGDEEKTTIESGDAETNDSDVGWEEDPSTTVEQGEVADRVARLGALSLNPKTNVTDTNGSVLDEPTVDDQRANASLSMMTPAALAVQTRLVVTVGNDRGRELDVAPGKSYTIGRGLDNDLVLTDIAVSRKHFDIRYEGNSWIVQDRGSGNGTLVNGNVEDAPFQLANSDIVEIGNTTFRIDIPNSLARASSNALPTVDVPIDVEEEEDEGSTMNGAPIKEKPIRRATTKPGATHAPRPKTVPPPISPRVHAGPTQPPFRPQTAPPSPNQTMPPGATTPMLRQGTAPAVGSSGLQRQGPMANGQMNPMMGQPMPTPGPMGPGGPRMLADMAQSPISMPQTTMPGTGPSLGPSALPDMFGAYPNGPQRQSGRGPMMGPNGMLIAGNGRDATSTGLVPSTPYGSMNPMMAPGALAPTGLLISRRTKLILGGAALMVFALIVTVAIIGGGDKPAKKIDAAPTQPVATMPTTATVDDKKVDDKKAADEKAAADKKAADEKAATDKKAADEKTAADKKAFADKKAADEKVAADKKAAEKKEADKQKVASDKQGTADKTAAKKAAAAEAKRVADEKRQAAADAAAAKKAAAGAKTPKTDKAPTGSKRVAFDASGAKEKADTLYRAKKFNDAAETLRAAAKAAGGEDAAELNGLARIYSDLGKVYNLGMAQGASPREAYEKLSKALSLDNSVGRQFAGEIKAKLSTVAQKAAIAYVSAQDWTQARSAIVYAESNGGATETIRSMKGTLESEAGKLYKAAQADSDSEAAKQKYRQIKAMVDSKSPWYAKAVKALGA